MTDLDTQHLRSLAAQRRAEREAFDAALVERVLRAGQLSPCELADQMHWPGKAGRARALVALAALERAGKLESESRRDGGQQRRWFWVVGQKPATAGKGRAA